jgi:hypothetical protein
MYIHSGEASDRKGLRTNILKNLTSRHSIFKKLSCLENYTCIYPWQGSTPNTRLRIFYFLFIYLLLLSYFVCFEK